MIARYDNLTRYPNVFRSMTGLRVSEFEELLDDMLPRLAEHDRERLTRANRKRAAGGGRHTLLAHTNDILLTVVWLRQYPTNEVLGYVFGISDSTASRIRTRVLPLLEAAGRDTMRLPDPGKKRRKTLDVLLAETPHLAVMIDTFAQRIQRPRDRQQANIYDSGKKKQHTLKSQMSVNEQIGEMCDVAESVAGPTADLALLKQSGLLDRLPDGVGAWVTWRMWGLARCICTGWVPHRVGNHAASRGLRRMCASTAHLRRDGWWLSTPSGGCVAISG